MQEEFKYKKQQDWLIDMWSANRRGENVLLHSYERKHKVKNVPKRLVWDIVTGKDCPTEEDTIEFMKRSCRYSTDSKAKRDANGSKPSQLDLPLEYPVELTEEICIEFLKKTGNYIIQRKVVNVSYEEV